MLAVNMVVHPGAGARSFVAASTPEVSLVVWDRASDLHNPGEVWGLFVGGRAPSQMAGLAEQTESVVFAARAHYGPALRVLPSQRGLSAVESQLLANLGLVAP